MTVFNLGLIVNPFAGVGGPAGLKGSDGLATVTEALSLGSVARAPDRCRRALAAVEGMAERIKVFTYAGAMGADLAKSMGFAVELVGACSGSSSSAEDTEDAARLLQARGVDLILFVGGDGTARDIYRAVGLTQPVLGVPAGVKMHSGVYAVSPEAAGEVLQLLLNNEPVPLLEQEVRDIDEAAFRDGKVRAKYYGELQVPTAESFVQLVKNSGRTPEPLQQADIAAFVIEHMEDGVLYVVGPGSTTLALMDEMGLAGTLLGVDLVCDKKLLAADVSLQAIEQACAQHDAEVSVIVTAIGGQGHVIGRGNQQISPALLRRAGRQGLKIIATPSKLEELEGRPLLIDSNDPELDRDWSGFCPVVVGYDEVVMYPLGLGE